MLPVAMSLYVLVPLLGKQYCISFLWPVGGLLIYYILVELPLSCGVFPDPLLLCPSPTSVFITPYCHQV